MNASKSPSPPAPSTGPAHVVVLGGGLAGVACAHRLGDEGIRVTLVDRNDYHQFQPLLYQVATAQLPAQDIARPHRTIFRAFPSVQVRTAEVVAVDPHRHRLTLADGDTVEGTHLVLAAGAKPEFFGVPGAAEHAFPLYSVPDAERLRLHVRALLEAATEGRPEPGALDVVVVGGGPTGVETAGAMVELMTAVEALGLVPAAGKVTIVDRGTALLGAFSERSQEYAHRRLSAHGVTIRLGTGVSAVHADRVELDDGSVLRTRTVVWGGGESAAAVVASSGLTTGRGGRLDVAPELTVPGHPRIYAIGDAANIPGEGGLHLPQLGSVAQQSGWRAADNILHELNGEVARPFRYKDKGIMAMIGRNAAVAEVGKHRHQVEGPVAFASWLGVHALLLSGAHSKADAFMEWAWDYFDRDHAAIVQSSGRPRRIVWGDTDTDVPNIEIDLRTGGAVPNAGLMPPTRDPASRRTRR